MSHGTIQLLIRSGLDLEKAKLIAPELDRNAAVVPRLSARTELSSTAKAAAQEKLAALGSAPAFASDAEKCRRALEREKILKDMLDGPGGEAA
jgi:hypothetical protein